MRINKIMGTVTLLATVVLGTPQARAADLTGVWFGEQQCDRFDGHKFHSTFAKDVMVISQSGDEMNMAALLINGVFQLLYQGRVINDAKNPERKAQAAFTECLTTPTSLYQETGRATEVEVKRNGHGEFEAKSIFLQLEQGEFPTDTGTCTWTYKRVDTEDPGVPICAAVFPSGTLQAPGTPQAPGTQRRRP